MDSSVRIITSNFSGLYKQVQETDGILLLTTTGHSTYAVTHPGMYLYLPSNMEALKREEQRETTMLVYRTQLVFDNVMRWWALCALNKDCIMPPRATKPCNFTNPDKFSNYFQCHRFDQSALNILTLNTLGFNSTFFYAKIRTAKIERFESVRKEPNYCRQFDIRN